MATTSRSQTASDNKWYIDPGLGAIIQATAAQAQSHGYLGPYASKAAAQAALDSSGGGTPVNWWIIQTFFSDGSSSWAVGTAKTGFDHPIPTADEVVWGPYSSQKDAQSAVDNHTFDQAQQSYRGSNVGNLGGISVPGNQAPGNPLSGIERLAAVIEAFFKVLTNFKMWRSLGWLVLGLILMLAGILLWLKIPQKAAQVGSVAAKAALLA